MKVTINLTRDSHNSYPHNGKLILQEEDDEIELNINDERTIRVKKDELQKALRILLED